MNKFKPIKRLFFQFGDLLTVPRLDAYELYVILEAAELIEGVAFASPFGAELPTHYREVRSSKLHYVEYLELVQSELVTYCQRQGLDYQRGPIGSAGDDRDERGNV